MIVPLILVAFLAIQVFSTGCFQHTCGTNPAGTEGMQMRLGGPRTSPNIIQR